MSGKKPGRRRRWLFSLRRYLTFFVLMAFVITCCMLLFLNTMSRATGLELSQPIADLLSFLLSAVLVGGILRELDRRSEEGDSASGGSGA